MLFSKFCFFSCCWVVIGYYIERNLPFGERKEIHGNAVFILLGYTSYILLVAEYYIGSNSTYI